MGIEVESNIELTVESNLESNLESNTESNTESNLESNIAVEIESNIPVNLYTSRPFPGRCSPSVVGCRLEATPPCSHSPLPPQWPPDSQDS